jgi:hypothetical protein
MLYANTFTMTQTAIPSHRRKNLAAASFAALMIFVAVQANHAAKEAAGKHTRTNVYARMNSDEETQVSFELDSLACHEHLFRVYSVALFSFFVPRTRVRYLRIETS